MSRRVRPLGTKPGGRPVQGAEECAGRNRGIAAPQLAAAHAGRHQTSDAAFVAVAFRHDERPQFRRKRVDFEMRRRAFDAVDQTEDMSDGKIVQAQIERIALAGGAVERRDQAVERTVLVVNRTSAAGVEMDHVARFFNRKPDIVVPYTEACDDAADRGRPLTVLHPDSAASKVIRDLAARIAVAAPAGR